MSDQFKQCPVCKLPDQTVLAEKLFDFRTTYECQRCGRYTIARDAEDDIEAEQKNKSAQLSGWLREWNIFDREIPILTSQVLETVLNNLPSYGPLEKQNKLLKAIAHLSSYPGAQLRFSKQSAVSLAWAENEEEIDFYLKSLRFRGFLLADDLPGGPGVTITSEGWEHLEKDQSDLLSKTQGFVAMSFDKKLRPLYDNAIAPAIDSTGYDPYRVDIPHLKRIDAKIIAEIRNSRFVVADVTQQKQGVYYEAGFAHGRGIPVIWSVRRNELKKVHFDTRQYTHILWETESELKEQLRDFILATIGKGRKRPT